MEPMKKKEEWMRKEKVTERENANHKEKEKEKDSKGWQVTTGR